MAFALIFVGLLLTISAVRGTYHTLFSLLHNDFVGQGNFSFWMISCLLIGAVGYIKPLRPLSHAGLVLIILVLILKRGNPSGVGGGLFAQLLSQVGSTTNVPVTSGAVSLTGTPQTQGVGITPISSLLSL